MKHRLTSCIIIRIDWVKPTQPISIYTHETKQKLTSPLLPFDVAGKVTITSAIIVHDKDITHCREDLQVPAFYEQWYEQVSREIISQAGIQDVAAPQFPSPQEPDYESWRKTFEELDVDDGSVLIGHGLGAGFLTRWLSKNRDVSVEQLVLVGPWHRHRQKSPGGEFLYYDLDRQLAKRVGRISLVTATDSSVNRKLSSRYLRRELGTENVYQRRCSGMGNFLVGNAMDSPEFPELLDVIMPADPMADS